MAKEKRTVVLFREVDKNADINEQEKIGSMSHWEAKKYVDEQPGNMIFFTLPKTEYDKLGFGKRRRGRKPRAAKTGS